uniref:BTB domain-containing protein n=1 Tax=Caenorhabditis japonica TaxID=281687 RepID=A0A8R1HYA3_CAEJA
MTAATQQNVTDAVQEKINLFTTETVLRKFQINTQTDTLYVNLNYLAELSEYFHILRTGAYAEMNSEKVELDDIFAEELVVFLSYVCPDGFEFDRTINQQNIYQLVYFSDRLIFPWVKQEIKKYFKSEDFKNEQYDTESLVQLCYLLHTQCYASDDIDPVFKKIARLSDTSLVDKAVEAIPNVNVKVFFSERIIHFRPYLYQPRPQSFFDWNDTRSRLFF